ncbi:MAG: DM13 domain-containing protein [Bacteroidota bacterium]
MRKPNFPLLAVLFLLASCVGTDFVDDPDSSKVPETIVISPTNASVLVGKQQTYAAKFYNHFGKEIPQVFAWSVTDTSLAKISSEGIVTGIKAGQVKVSASLSTIRSEEAWLTILESAESVASVKIVSGASKMYLTESIALQLEVVNASMQPVKNPVIRWESADPSIATIDQAGRIFGVKAGTAVFTAFANGIKSAPVSVEIAPISLTATIVQGTVVNDYANGTAKLLYAKGKLSLQLENDFLSNKGPSLFVYLANCAVLTSANLAECVRLELSPLKSLAGFQTYDIPAGVWINDYSHVIIQCKPFVVTFGSGKFQ